MLHPVSSTGPALAKARGVEDGGGRHLCQVCALDREEPHDALYVILWGPGAVQHPTLGGMVRLCWEHLDELATLILEVL